MRELYLYRRIQRFEESVIMRKSVSRIFRDDLLTEKVRTPVSKRRIGSVKGDRKQYKKRAETKHRGTLCALCSKEVTVANKMPEKQIFIKRHASKAKSEIPVFMRISLQSSEFFLIIVEYCQ